MIAGLQISHPLADLKGAPYNPRKIDEESIQRLQKSLKTIGVCKPIIVRGQTIVAGHQRTRALKGMGITHAPVYFLSVDATDYDEVRFNQLHNGTDMDMGDEYVKLGIPLGSTGFVSVPAKNIMGNMRSSGASIRAEIMKMIVKFGPWGACVCNQSGEVFHAAQYALSCKATASTLLAFVVPPETELHARQMLSDQYGVFSYDGLKRDTYMQTFAQMFRLRDGVRENTSINYEGLLMPWYQKNKGARILDFGCGQGDYVSRLSKNGINIIGIEFFRRVIGKNAIDVGAVNKMVDVMIDSVKSKGRFDAVICDYVLNSVDSQQAEEDVLACLGGFCKPKGRIFLSGRRKERIDDLLKMTKNINEHRDVEFLDNNGLTALYKKGKWFYQKYHSQNDIERLVSSQGWKIIKQTKTAVAWQCEIESGEKINKERFMHAIEREFNMQISESGRTLNRHNSVLEIIK
jgi:ParB family chromosome partitioning protein